MSGIRKRVVHVTFKRDVKAWIDNDLRNGGRHHPDLLEQYAALEARTGYTMHMNRIPIRELATDIEKQERAA